MKLLKTCDKFLSIFSAMLIYFKVTKKDKTKKFIEDLETHLDELKQFEADEPEIIKEHYNKVMDSQQNRLKEKERVNIEDIQDVEMLLDDFNLTDKDIGVESQTMNEFCAEEVSACCCLEESCKKGSKLNDCSCHCETQQDVKLTEGPRIKLKHFVDIYQEWGKIETLLNRHDIPQGFINGLRSSVIGIDK